MAPQVWTKEEDARLIELWNLGEKTAEIARIMTRQFRREITKNAAVGRRKRIAGLVDRGSPIKRLSDEVKSKISTLMQNGASTRAIAEKAKISDGAVRTMRRANYVHTGVIAKRPRPVVLKPTAAPTVFKYIPHAKCLSPDGCSEVIAPHSPFAYCVKHRRVYYSYDPMTDRGRAKYVLEELEKV